MNAHVLPLAQVPLKEMDSSLLAMTLLRDAHRLGVRDSIESALSYASYFHLGQTRMNRANLPRTPYIEHPLRNTIRIIRWGFEDEAMLIASLLHDVPEDCAERVSEVAGRFDGDLTEIALGWVEETYGAEVAPTVRAVTNDESPPRASEKEKHSGYREHVRVHVLPNPRALVVKAADLIDNAGSLHHHIGHASLASLQRRARKYLPVVRDVVEAIQRCLRDGTLPHFPAAAVSDALYATERSLLRILAMH